MAAYSLAPQLSHPSTKARIIEYKMYAKIEYKVHSALNRREVWRCWSSRAEDLVSLVDKVARVFSKEAAELSSPYIELH